MNEKERREYTDLLITKYDLLYEQRLTVVETDMKHISETVKEMRVEMRWFFGIWLGTFGTLLGVMAKGFHWIGG